MGEGFFSKSLHVPLSQHLQYYLTHCLLKPVCLSHWLKLTLYWDQISLKENAIALKEFINRSKRLNIFTEVLMPMECLREGKGSKQLDSCSICSELSKNCFAFTI